MLDFVLTDANDPSEWIHVRPGQVLQVTSDTWSGSVALQTRVFAGAKALPVTEDGVPVSFTSDNYYVIGGECEIRLVPTGLTDDVAVQLSGQHS